MPHSLGRVYVHLVLSTRGRIPFLADRALRSDLHGYMTGIFRRLKCPSLRIGGAGDHVHALFRLSRVVPIVHVVREVQRGSSRWLARRGVRDFGWQEDYGAFSVSPEHVDSVTRYVLNQESYHREVTFAAEYQDFLRRSGGLEHRVDVHLVFSTKNRLPLLGDEAVRRRFHGYVATLCETLACPSLKVGGVEDHLHILYRLCPHHPIAWVTQEIKKRSARWLTTHQGLEFFDWQGGYGAFSVSPRDFPAVVHYIANQEEHHRQETAGLQTRSNATWE